MSFGEKFKELVDSSGQSYEKIACALGFKSKSSVSHYMKSNVLPKYNILLRMCEYFNVPTAYFEDGVAIASQPEREYQTVLNKVPVFTSESADAEEVSYMIIPHMGLTDGFGIIIDDDRLESMGIMCGSTVILSKKFTLQKKHRIIAECNGKRFFATYEKMHENQARIIPANPEIMPVILDGKKDLGTTIYAVVKSVIYNE